MLQENAETFADPSARLQGRNRTRSLEARHHRHFQILKIYPICRWSAILGRNCMRATVRTPESFCTITPDLMNPNSNYDLAINTGFPNSFDKANNHDGTLLDAEDALIAALKVKMQRPEALIAYVSQQNKRGDTRHPMRRLSSENA